MRLRNGGRDGESHANATGGATARLLQSHKRRRDALHVFRRNARSFITDADNRDAGLHQSLDHVAGRAAPDVDPRALDRKAELLDDRQGAVGIVRVEQVAVAPKEVLDRILHDQLALPQHADPVADAIKQERWERFMETAAEISAERLQAKIGSRMQVLVDEVDGSIVTARSKADAPEIDGNVIIELDAKSTPNAPNPGDLVDVEVINSDEYDLYARLD